MISYRDMTFCGFYEDCAKANDCPRPLTPEVKQAAAAWWGDGDAPIARLMHQPECHVIAKESGDTAGG